MVICAATGFIAVLLFCGEVFNQLETCFCREEKKLALKLSVKLEENVNFKMSLYGRAWWRTLVSPVL